RPVSVGRTMRILPARSRRLIEDRDRGCRFPGCTATRFVEVHHLRGWAEGGATDVDNQVSLCPFHHDAIDRGDFTITGDPTRHDGLVVANRYGHRLRPPSPAEVAPPDGSAAEDDEGPTTYRPPTGERARWSEIELPSDREVSDTLTPQLRLVRDAATSAAKEPATIERDPFDVIRRWDESG
ncbi:MAG: HNH endonuclease, partial [Pedococcus sp.]